MCMALRGNALGNCAQRQKSHLIFFVNVVPRAYTDLSLERIVNDKDMGNSARTVLLRDRPTEDSERRWIPLGSPGGFGEPPVDLVQNFLAGLFVKLKVSYIF